MAINFPTSVEDTTSMPTRASGNTIPASDSNDKRDSLIATQQKIGTGSSTPASGKVLRATGTGTSAWGGVQAGDIDSATLVDSTDTIASNHNDTTVPTTQAVKDYTDGAILGAGGYNDEAAQDAVGGILTDTSTIDFTYADATPSITADVKDDSVTNAKLANVATSTIKGRSTAGTGDPEDLTASQVRTLINVANGATANSSDATLLARANHTGTQLAATISDFDSQVRTNRVDQLAAPLANVDLNSNKIVNLTDPSSAQDAATKTYVDSVAAGLDAKASVRAASTANGALATAYENGDTLDGVTLATGDRILLKDQTTASENGIYTVNASGAPTRATDANTSAKVTPGMFTFVEEGTTNADTGWVLNNNGTITLGSTSLSFTQFSAAGIITAGTGLTKTGNQLAIDSTVATLTGSQTLTNKTLTTPVISSISNTGTLTLPTSTDTLVGRDTTDTLTNKTLTTPTIGSFTNATHNHTNAAGGGQISPLTALTTTGTPSSSTYLRGDNTWATVAAGGQSIATKIVAPSGGDYTTLGAALAAASAGWSIVIYPGTYTESAITNFALANVSITGFDPESTVLDFSTNSFSTTSAATNLRIDGVKLNFSTGSCTFAGANTELVNIHLNKSGTTGTVISVSGADSIVMGSNFTSASTANTIQVILSGNRTRIINNNFTLNNSYTTSSSGTIQLSGTYMVVSENVIIRNTTGSGYFVGITAANVTFTDNVVYDSTTSSTALLNMYGGSQANVSNNQLLGGDIAVNFGGSDSSGSSFCGNNIHTTGGSGFQCTTSGAGNSMSIVGNRIRTNNNGIYDTQGMTARSTISGNRFIAQVSRGVGLASAANCTNVSISGNTFDIGTGGTGVELGGGGQASYVSIVGNTFNAGTYGIDGQSHSYWTASGNTFNGQSSLSINMGGFTNAKGVSLQNNIGTTPDLSRRVIRVKNTSGGTIAAGAPVIIKTGVTNGYEVTTTTTAGDKAVYGITEESIASTAFGMVLLEGKTAVAAANGTTDIAVGDYLSCYTTAGILQKAASTHTAIAIALEAYTADDSLGVLDALVIQPKYIP